MMKASVDQNELVASYAEAWFETSPGSKSGTRPSRRLLRGGVV